MLLAEYAIEPQALSTWERFRYIADLCGVPTGRLIADFPANWCREVWNATKDCPPVARKKVEEKLQALKRVAIIDLGRSYDQHRSWQQNAIMSHADMEFRAIIADNPEDTRVFDINLLDASEEPWKTTRERAVPRTADELSLSASYLLMMAKEVVFVDPYFSPEDSRCRHPLMKFLECVSFPISRLEFHLCRRNSGSPEHFGDMLKTKIVPALQRVSGYSSAQRFFLIRWNELPTGDGEAVHPRYIFTDKGGLRFEHGLAEESETETTDVSLLDEFLYQQRRSQYGPSSSCFEFSDGWCVQNGQVLPVTSENGVWRRI